MGWEFIEGAAQDFGSDAVGGGDVVEGDGKHLHFTLSDLVDDGVALVLMKEGNGVDEGEVFFVVASGASSATGEGEVTSVGVGDFPRLQKTLHVLHELEDVFAVFGGEESFGGSGFALELVDALGLRLGFVDGEDEAAVEEFFVDVDRGGGEDDGDGAFDVVLLGFHASGLRVFAGARDSEFAFGL